PPACARGRPHVVSPSGMGRPRWLRSSYPRSAPQRLLKQAGDPERAGARDRVTHRLALLPAEDNLASTGGQNARGASFAAAHGLEHLTDQEALEAAAGPGERVVAAGTCLIGTRRRRLQRNLRRWCNLAAVHT